MSRILLLDNYDSFVHNLARYLCELGCETLVVRSDAITVAGIEQLAPSAVILSPGPGTPSEGMIYLLFEGGPDGMYSGIHLARFNLAWVLEGETTED